MSFSSVKYDCTFRSKILNLLFRNTLIYLSIYNSIYLSIYVSRYYLVLVDPEVWQSNVPWCIGLHVTTTYFMISTYFWVLCEVINDTTLEGTVCKGKMKGGIGWYLSISGVDRDPAEFYLMFLSREIDIKHV